MTAKKFNTLVPSDRVKKVREAIAAGRPLVEPPRKPEPDKGAKSSEGTVNPNPVPDARKFSASMKLFVTNGKPEITLYKENSRTMVKSEDEIELQGGFRIGRHPATEFGNKEIQSLLKRCKASIVVTDRRVSKQHAIILHEDLPNGNKGWFIHDLGSMNGTYVNGQRITAPHMLCNGEIIAIGRLRFTVSIASDTAQTKATRTEPFPPAIPFE